MGICDLCPCRRSFPPGRITTLLRSSSRVVGQWVARCIIISRPQWLIWGNKRRQQHGNPGQKRVMSSSSTGACSVGIEPGAPTDSRFIISVLSFQEFTWCDSAGVLGRRGRSVMERGGSTTRSGLVRFDPCMCSSPPRVSVNWVGHYDRLAPDFSRPFRYNTKFLPKLREVKSTEEEVADNGIPKILHHIWLGGELPPHFQLLRQEDRLPGGAGESEQRRREERHPAPAPPPQAHTSPLISHPSAPIPDRKKS
eukprot:3524839-Rhodomonas_salina.2